MNDSAQAAPLALLLQLEQRSRQVNRLSALHFIIVNETYQLLPFRQAVLWRDDLHVCALSGVALPDGNAPFVLWLRSLAQVLIAQVPADAGLVPVNGRTLPDKMAAEWLEWLPEHGLLCPLRQGAESLGWLLLGRDEPFGSDEQALLTVLLESYSFAWRCHERKKSRWYRFFPGRRRWLLLLLLGLLACPVKLSVLAPAELVAISPEVIRAPMEGVIARFHVVPNAVVRAGERLLDLDDTALRGRLDSAEKGLAIAESEYQLTAQIALQDPRSKAQLAILSGRAEEKRSEVEALRGQLQRTQVAAKQAGLALFTDPLRWIGKPVVTGERIMVVAEEQDTEVEIWLAVGDLIPLPQDAAVTLFLNIDPLHPLAARVRLLAYEAELRPDRTMAHLLRATLVNRAGGARVGLKGTARIDGEDVTLLWWMLRRPLAMVRQWLGV
ncbi:MAG: secretion protein HylD [Magnetococcales bacterium]|nr:secretion protein HylD [Magnetococcales bacterium]MBF0115329.1 secretion protein HylD [Magnetococcales bacterium]